MQNCDMETIYNPKILGNTAIVGKTGAGKTSLVQQWQKCNFLADEKVYWIHSKELLPELKKTNSKLFENISYYEVKSPIALADALNEIRDVERSNKNESNEQKGPDLEKGEDQYENDKDQELETKKLNKDLEEEYVPLKEQDEEEDALGEKTIYTKSIILDDMTTIANKCPEFLNYMTLARKDQMSIIATFHNFDKSENSFAGILENLDNIVFMRLGEPQRILTYLGNKGHLYENTDNYLPKKSNWLVRLYQKTVLNSEKGEHLLVHNGDTIPPGPARYRTKTGSKPDRFTQYCYLATDGGKSYKKYVAEKSINDESDSQNILFAITQIVGKTRAGEDIKISVAPPKRQASQEEGQNFDSKRNKFSELENGNDDDGSVWRSNGRADLDGGSISSFGRPSYPKPKYLH